MAVRLIFTTILASMVASSYAQAAATHQDKDTLVEIDGKGENIERSGKTQGATNSAQVVIDGEGSLVGHSEDVKEAPREYKMRTEKQREEAPREYKMRTEKQREEVSKTPRADEVSLAQEDDYDGDVALDELEAMTIEAALLRKHFSPPPPVNCKWSDWENNGPCSKSCGGGSQPKERSHEKKAAHGGQPCSGKDNKIDTCKNDACPTTVAPTPAPTTTPAGAMRNGGISLFLIVGLWVVVPQ